MFEYNLIWTERMSILYFILSLVRSKISRILLQNSNLKFLLFDVCRNFFLNLQTNSCNYMSVENLSFQGAKIALVYELSADALGLFLKLSAYGKLWSRAMRSQVLKKLLNKLWNGQIHFVFHQKENSSLTWVIQHQNLFILMQ